VHPPAFAGLGVEEEPKLGEVDLALHPRVAIEDAHRVGDPEPAPLDREAVQRAVGHRAPRPGEQLLDLHHRQAVLDPRPDLVLPPHQRLPRRAVPVRARRAHRGDHRRDQRVINRAHPGVPREPGGLRGLDIAAGGLAVHP
jgi:hypothetical protein